MNSGKHQKFNVQPGQSKKAAQDVGLKHRATAIYERITSIDMHDCLIEVDWKTDRQHSVKCDDSRLQSPDQTTSWPLGLYPSQRLSPKRGHAVAGPNSGSPVMLFAVLDRNTDQIANTLRQIEQQQLQTNNFLPLFLTNNPCHRVFRQAGYNFEYFPSDIYCRDTQNGLFQRKFLNIWAKWKAETLVDFSAPGFLKSRIEQLEKYTLCEQSDETSYNSRRKRPVARAAPPTDVAALKAEYLTKGLDKDADTFVLYRILGNDLPPRHSAGQTLANLRFMLDHEPEFENCEKRWVVNRIVNPEQEAPILELLEKHDQPYLRIPFDLEEYRLQDWDLDGFPRPDFFLNGPFGDMTEYDQQRAEAHVRRHKNCYAINNNGARNAALRDGRDRAKWVLPWDGNCFLTADAWAEIADGVTRAPYLKYFTVPMARTLDNSDLLQDGYRPEAEDEPQILFRSDASEEFDEQFPYGRRPKVELFLRLGIAGRWDGWYDDKWDLRRPTRADEAGACGNAGWVSRLFSGQKQLEGAETTDLRSRGVARITAVNAMLDQLDQKAISTVFDPSKLTAYDEGKILALKAAPAGSPKEKMLSRLVQEAELALQRGPYSVVDKLSDAPSGDKHDYFNPAPYYWPNPNTPNGLPLVFRDGERIPGTRLYDPESDQFDRTRLQRMFDDTTTLAMAWKATGEIAYAEHAAQNIRHWFLSEDSKMNPHLQYAQANLNNTSSVSGKSGLIEMKDLYYMLDAVRLLEQSGTIADIDTIELRDWLTDYLDWLLTSDQGVAERKSRNNHGTCYDLQVASIAAYLGDEALLNATLRTSRERLMTQFDPDGTQPLEMARTQTAHYCCFNLQSWINLATLADRCGDDLWQIKGQEGQGLTAAFNWVLPYLAKADWPYKQIERFDRDRFLPLFFAARDLCEGSSDKDGAKPEQAKPLFFPHFGIKPFWTLGIDAHSVMPPEMRQTLSKTVIKCESPVVDCVASLGAQAGSNAEVSMLDKKMWGGFSLSARRELEAIKYSSEAPQADKNKSARMLARWHFTAQDYQKTLENIVEMRGLDAVNQREQNLVRAYCLDQLGRTKEAEPILSQAHLLFPGNSNLCLSMANLCGGLTEAGQDDGRQTGLDWLNRVYVESSLQPLAVQNTSMSQGLEILSADPKPDMAVNIEGGALVSVVVPIGTKDNAAAVGLNSLLRQTWRNLEILIVDYSGAADIRDMIDKMASTDSRIKILPPDQTNLEYEAQNLGLSHAMGRYVTTLAANEFAHPQKIALQVNALADHECQAVLTCHALLTPDMRFVAGWHPEFSLVPVQTSSMMLATDTLKELGGWDPVNGDPGPYLMWRLKKTLGNSSVHVVESRIPLSFSMATPHANQPTHQSFAYGKQRDHFKKLVRATQKQAAQDAVDGRPTEETQAVLSVPASRSNPNSVFDIVFVGDFSEGVVGVSVLMEQLSKLDLSTQAVGIFNWPDYQSGWTDNLCKDLADLIDTDDVTQISGHETATAKLLVLCNPYVIKDPVDGLPNFGAVRVDVLCGPQISNAEIFDGVRYHMPSAGEIEAAFQAPCKWVAI